MLILDICNPYNELFLHNRKRFRNRNMAILTVLRIDFLFLVRISYRNLQLLSAVCG